MSKGVIFIEEKCAYKKKVRYEFTYLDYLYYSDRKTWEKIVNGYYPTNDEEDDTLCVKEESECGEDMSTIAERIARELAEEKKSSKSTGNCYWN